MYYTEFQIQGVIDLENCRVVGCGEEHSHSQWTHPSPQLPLVVRGLVEMWSCI